jgi:bacteriocin biosynthesis cyclodehydratase domain-containing protein
MSSASGTEPAAARPCLKPWYRLLESPDGILLRYGDHVVGLSGAAVEALIRELLPLLNGTRTVEQIEAEIGEDAAGGVRPAVEQLTREGLLLEGPLRSASGGSSASAQFLSAQNGGLGSPSELAGRLQSASVAVLGSGPMRTEIVRLLHDAGALTVTEQDDFPDTAEAGIDLRVVVPDQIQLRSLIDLNRVLLDAGSDWLPVLPHDGAAVGVGPLIVPGATCCFHCYLLRRAGNDFLSVDPVDAYLAETPQPRLAPLEAVAAGVAASLAISWLAGPRQELVGTLHAVELGSAVSVEGHRVLRVPRCPACSPSERRATPEPWATPTNWAEGG